MRRYRLIDFVVFALLLCALEAASAWATGVFPGEAYTFSPALFFALLMMARWGAPGTVFAALGGAVYCFLRGGTAVQYAAYIAGNCAVAVNLLWMRPIGMARIRQSNMLLSLYCLSGYLSVNLGRAAVSRLLGQGGWLPRFLATDAFGAVVTLIILFIARRQDGLLEPQRDYILRIHKEEEGRKHGS